MAAFYIAVLGAIGGLVCFAEKQSEMFGEPQAEETGAEEPLIDHCLNVIHCRLFPWKYATEARRCMAYQLSDRVLRLFWRKKVGVPS